MDFGSLAPGGGPPENVLPSLLLCELIEIGGSSTKLPVVVLNLSGETVTIYKDAANFIPTSLGRSSFSAPTMAPLCGCGISKTRSSSWLVGWNGSKNWSFRSFIVTAKHIYTYAYTLSRLPCQQFPHPDMVIKLDATVSPFLWESPNLGPHPTIHSLMGLWNALTGHFWICSQKLSVTTLLNGMNILSVSA